MTEKIRSKLSSTLSSLIDWNTVKRVLWYAGSQAVVIFIASATDYISSIQEPNLTTILLGVLLAQVTKALNTKSK
jgi:hypothetical protein